MNEGPINSASGGRSVKSTRRMIAWILLLLIVVVTLTIVFIPVWLIMPFKMQTARGISLSYALKSWSPSLTLGALIISLALCIWLSRGARWYGWVALMITLLPLFVVAWFARQNHFEWMFNPLPKPEYAKVSQADFIKDNEMVMSVVINGEAVAYPVRQMAYHHVVQDQVGGLQVVTTY